MLIVPDNRRWRRQPDGYREINWGYWPLSRGAYALYTGGSRFAWLGGPVVSPSVDTGEYVPVAPAGGSYIGRYFDGSTYTQFTAPAISTPFSMVGWAKTGATSGAITSLSTAGGSGRYQIALGGTVGNYTANAQTSDAAGAGSAAYTTTQYVADTWNQVVGVFASSTSRKCYLNGGGEGSNTTSSSASPDRFLIGARIHAGTLGAYLTGNVGLVMILPWALSADDVKRLYAEQRENPWAIFAPRRDVLYFFPAAGGGVTLSVADLSHAHALDAPTLTQAHSLALSDLSHAHTLDAVSLGQAHVLALSDLSNAHTLDAPTLTVHGSLSVADATHAHALDALTLSQAHVLAVSGLDYAHALDAVTLAAQGSLSVADLSHAQSIDAPALTQAHVLAVSDATHGHSLDALVLVYGAALSPADLSHGHALDAPTLTQAHLLAVEDLLHAHAAEALTLGYAAELVVSDLLHAHLLDRSNVYEGVLEVHLDPRRLVAVAPENRFFILQGERRITVVAPQSFLRTQ